MRFFLIYLAVGVPLVLFTHYFPVWATRRFIRRLGPTYERLELMIAFPLWPLAVLGFIRGWPYRFNDVPPTTDVEVPLTPERQRELALVARRQDEMARYSKQLPYCSQGLRVILRDYPDNLDSVGVFYCSSTELQDEIAGRVKKNPHLADDHEGWLLAWLAARHDEDTELVTAPIAYTRLTVAINGLVRQKIGWFECLGCQGKMFDMQGVTYVDDAGQPGENFNRVLCPSGHLLLRSLRLRFIGRRG